MAASTLPMGILVQELLPRLPVKSLLRFKCVSKFFQTLISTPEFAQRHLRHSLASDDNRLLILVRELLGVYSFHLDSPRFHSVSFFFPPAKTYYQSTRLTCPIEYKRRRPSHGSTRRGKCGRRKNC
uniref:F-box domain-containing protein n=1 Tax=Opuntia streptacantha TaxID=393608 RepID=A0A7C8Z358_OPUST